MIKNLSAAAVIIICSMTAAHAQPAVSAALQPAAQPAAKGVHLIASRKFKRQRARKGHRSATSFSAPTRRVFDTCPGGDKACIKELIANCEKANGGLSTEPDGGVDCYVVGIHDQ